jgi:outer membrane protein assembly factor BamB
VETGKGWGTFLPIVVDGKVFFVVADNSSTNKDEWTHAINAIDASSGKELWRSPTTTGWITSTPAVYNGVLCVGDNVNGKIYTINIVDGTERWTFSTKGSIEASPAIVEGTLFIGSNDSNMYAIDVASGAEKWNSPAEVHLYSSPAVIENTVFASCSDGLIAFDAASGVEQWRFDTGDVPCPSPAVVDGTVYIGGGETFGDRYLHALDASSGEERWRYHLQEDYGVWISSPAVHMETVVIASDGARMYGIDVTNGKERWTLDTELFPSAPESPILVDNIVFDIWQQNACSARDLHTGKELWHFDTTIWFPESLSVVNGMIIAGGYKRSGDSVTNYAFALGNLLPTLLAKNITLRGAPSEGAIERGKARTGAEIDHVGARE